MKLLVADDDPLYRQVFSHLFSQEFEVVLANDGAEAWDLLQRDRSLHLALLNWRMPKLSGPEVCQRVRATPDMESVYLLIATAKQNIEDVIAGFGAGADDYITKPFHSRELIARVMVGRRVVELQADLAHRIVQLQEASQKVKLLQGLLPICSYCKRIRDDNDYWEQVETYITEHTHVMFSHSICPDCYRKFLRPEMGGADE